MYRVLAICNQKGGVYKINTIVNLGMALVRSGKRVLVIEADPQSNLFQTLGIKNRGQSNKSFER